MEKKTLLAGFSVLILGIAIVGVGLACHQQTAEGINDSSIPFIPKIAGSIGVLLLTAPFPVVTIRIRVYRTVLPRPPSEEVRRLGMFRFSRGDEVRAVKQCCSTC